MVVGGGEGGDTKMYHLSFLDACVEKVQLELSRWGCREMYHLSFRVGLGVVDREMYHLSFHGGLGVGVGVVLCCAVVCWEVLWCWCS